MYLFVKIEIKLDIREMKRDTEWKIGIDFDCCYNK